MQAHLIARHLLTESGALMTNGHFVLASGKHSATYLNKARLTYNPLITSSICNLLAEGMLDTTVDVIVTPAIGAIPLGQQTAFMLSQLRRDIIGSVYAEKDGNGFTLKRGFAQDIKGKRVGVVEDVLTTGTSTKSVIDAVQRCGGNVVLVAAICNRGGVTAETLGVQNLVTLLDLDLPTWEEGSCELCLQQVPINPEPGHGAAFLARQTA